MKRLFALITLAGLTTAAHAVDGVYEINSACVSFGCFSGDSGGFPVTIANPGSYRLTSNLNTTSANTTLIEVTADNVSIDLNGFSLTGPASCSGSSVVCTNTGTGIGINASSRENVRVYNGTVRGMGQDGIVVGGSAWLEALNIVENGRDGVIAASPGSVLRRLSVRENGRDGVVLGFGSSYIMDSVMYNNGSEGVFGGFCGNIVSSGNDSGDACSGVAPNFCSTPTDCD
ncbi:MAG: hypothetical protein Kow0020_06620 [Wenzhouxiangellaceae bacterium]